MIENAIRATGFYWPRVINLICSNLSLDYILVFEPYKRVYFFVFQDAYLRDSVAAIKRYYVSNPGRLDRASIYEICRDTPAIHALIGQMHWEEDKKEIARVKRQEAEARDKESKIQATEDKRGAKLLHRGTEILCAKCSVKTYTKLSKRYKGEVLCGSCYPHNKKKRKARREEKRRPFLKDRTVETCEFPKEFKL